MRTLILTAALIGAAMPTVLPQTPPKRTIADGVYTKEQAARGLSKYTEACSRCHQADLTGSDQAPALAGGDFVDHWQGQTVGDLADRIRTSMPADDVGTLTVQMSADLTAYLLQANNFPAGVRELPADRSELKSIAIATAK